VDAFAAFAFPVDVAEIKPEGELVESERRAEAVEDRKGDARDARCSLEAGTDLQQPSITDGEEQQDAPDHVVDVQVAARDVVKGSNAVADGMGDDADDDEREEEGDGGEEEALPPGFSEMLLVECAEASFADRRGEEPQGEGDEDFKRPGVDVAHFEISVERLADRQRMISELPDGREELCRLPTGADEARLKPPEGEPCLRKPRRR